MHLYENKHFKLGFEGMCISSSYENISCPILIQFSNKNFTKLKQLNNCIIVVVVVVVVIIIIIIIIIIIM